MTAVGLALALVTTVTKKCLSKTLGGSGSSYNLTIMLVTFRYKKMAQLLQSAKSHEGLYFYLGHSMERMPDALA